MIATVNKIINFSCVDGPGNRMAIFFQGCNYSCTYCHNPETINTCINCKKCVSKCPVQALSVADERVLWDEKKCVKCDECIKACDKLSSPKTKNYTVDELFNEIKRVKAFIKGITVSGGECTLYADFLVQLFKRVKNELNLTCFVDTNGGYDLTLDDELVEVTDKFMLDVKSIDCDEHNRVTGVSNEVVLKNLNYLLDKDKIYEVRTVVVPNLNSLKTIDEISYIIKEKCLYKIITYRKYGVRPDGIDFHGELSPSKEDMEKYLDIAIGNGCINAFIV